MAEEPRYNNFTVDDLVKIGADAAQRTFLRSSREKFNPTRIATRAIAEACCQGRDDLTLATRLAALAAALREARQWIDECPSPGGEFEWVEMENAKIAAKDRIDEALKKAGA